MRLLLFVSALPLMLLRCDVPTEPSCAPGASAPCSCTNGLAGAQLCNGSGSGFLACVCDGEQAAPPEADAGADTEPLPDAAADASAELDTQGGSPRLHVAPGGVIFGVVPVGQTDTQPLTLKNAGTGTLVVTHVGFTGDSQFTLDLGDLHTGPAGSLVLAEPLALGPGDSVSALVTFAPLEPGHAKALLRVFSSDPTLPEGLAVEIRGNLTAPCIKVEPASVSFGTVPTGVEAVRTVWLRSCGDFPLTITALGLDPDFTADAFSLNLAAVPGLEAGPPSLDDPLVITHNEPVYVAVRYVPVEPSVEDEGGVLVPDEGRLVFESDGGPPVVVPLMGRAVGASTLVAVASVDEGPLVVPQTLLHLRSGDSTAGPAASYEWTVDQPMGSQSIFQPGADAANPTFEANVAGTYTFSLRVRDALEQVSEPAVLQVVVVPDQAIHVELLWDTPNDPDQSDEGPEAGTDMDLHFTHEYASGQDLDGDGKPDGWFDQPFDCFWFNPAPNWGSSDPAVDDDPSLDRDDTEGAGPENLNLSFPEPGRTYRIGVHYWHDHGFGPSWATVRVYVFGQLVWQESGVKLHHHDLWEAATIAWPSGKVSPVLNGAGERKITASYENPFFFQP